MHSLTFASSRNTMAPRPMLMAAVAACVLALLVGCAESRTYDRCGLVRELRRQGFTDLRNWVCLVENESGRDTSKRGPRNKNGSYDYGLFQINSKYWCSIGKVGGDCNAKCENFLNDDISDDSRCAKKIFGRHGFDAWYGWKNHCKGKPLPDISKC